MTYYDFFFWFFFFFKQKTAYEMVMSDWSSDVCSSDLMKIPKFYEPLMSVWMDTGKSATIVDGWMLSNFPVWLFDVQDRDPKRPTFGFRLVGGKGVGGGMQAVVNGLG